MDRRDADAWAASRRRPRHEIEVDGRRIAYVREGHGDPPIVLTAGAGMDIDAWFKVLPGSATVGDTVAWDRPGVGRSDPPDRPQTGDVVVATLRRLLAGPGIAPPYVLVGHSFGGLHVELFARRHPDEVTGVVLVESATPEEAEAGPGRPGAVARAVGSLGGWVDRVRGRGASAAFAETAWARETIRQLAEAPPFPDVPLVVVTGGRRMRFVPEAAFLAHRAAQRSLVALSPQGRQVIAARSGHFPQVDEPEVVVEAIRSVRAGSGATDPVLHSATGQAPGADPPVGM